MASTARSSIALCKTTMIVFTTVIPDTMLVTQVHAGVSTTRQHIHTYWNFPYAFEKQPRRLAESLTIGRIDLTASYFPGSMSWIELPRKFVLHSTGIHTESSYREAIGNSLPPVDRLSLGNSQSGMLCPPPPSQVAPATISPQFLGSLQHWENAAPRSASLTSPEEDSFMSWDDPRRREWSQQSMPL